MFMTFKIQNGPDRLRELFKTHIKERTPLNAAAITLVAKLVNNISVSGNPYDGQATLIRCHLDHVYEKGMMVSPTSLLQNRGEKMLNIEAQKFAVEVRDRVAAKIQNGNVSNLIRKSLRIDSERDIIYTINLLYALMVMGTGELQDGQNPALPN